MADDQLDALERRLENLEKTVFGGADKDAYYPKCVDTLTNIQNKLNTAVAGRKKIGRLYERLSELQCYLDPRSADELTLSQGAKAELILAEEEFLCKQAARFDTMQKLKDTVDSEHIKAVPSLAPKLQDLSQLQIKQQDQTAELTEDTRHLLASYNSIITILSKQFVQWDEILTKLEQETQSKTVFD
ncbi:hypothetical protein ACJMK2_044194 [Sinanodonta woodiana]|uniref:Dynactin subunit 3 n=1 Tax=Sinanodonta woodiana TaxID=1069815 RepID=A0ABD3VZC4_SINWO